MPTDATTQHATTALRSILSKDPSAQRHGARRAHDLVWRQGLFAPVAFGATDCDSPELYGHPDCVFAWFEFQEERVSSLTAQLAKKLAEAPSLASAPIVLEWTNNFFPSWEERRKELRDSLLRKQQNLEPFEGAPDNPEEDATDEHKELDEWARQIARFQREFSALGVDVKPAEFKPEKPSTNPLEQASSLVSSLALLGGVAVAAYLAVTLSKPSR